MILYTFKEASPSQLFSVTMTWRRIDTENSVIRRSNFERHKPPFWICVNIRDIIKVWVKQNNHAFWKSTARGKKDRSQPVISYLMDLFGDGFHLKYKYLYSGFCKIQVQSPASLDLRCHQHWRRACCNLWTITNKETGSLDQLQVIIHFFRWGLRSHYDCSGF